MSGASGLFDHNYQVTTLKAGDLICYDAKKYCLTLYRPGCGMIYWSQQCLSSDWPVGFIRSVYDFCELVQLLAVMHNRDIKELSPAPNGPVFEFV